MMVAKWFAVGHATEVTQVPGGLLFRGYIIRPEGNAVSLCYVPCPRMEADAYLAEALAEAGKNPT